jgi:hypothetical protein
MVQTVVANNGNKDAVEFLFEGRVFKLSMCFVIYDIAVQHNVNWWRQGVTL